MTKISVEEAAKIMQLHPRQVRQLLLSGSKIGFVIPNRSGRNTYVLYKEWIEEAGLR